MPTIQEKRLAHLKAQLERTMEQREETIERLVKTYAKVTAINRAIRGLEKRMAKPRLSPARPMSDAEFAASITPLPADVVRAIVTAPPAEDLAIPTFLQRSAQTDEQARLDIIAEQQFRKHFKARARIDRMKAKKAGDLDKMPLTGKAALDAIKRGSP